MRPRTVDECVCVSLHLYEKFSAQAPKLCGDLIVPNLNRKIGDFFDYISSICLRRR